ncbi:MAG: O-antigen polymerase [candidate division WOR-3 bacterium]
MTTFLLILFLIECISILYWGLKTKGRMYEYPFLAGCVFTFWVLPQLIGLSNNQSVSNTGLNKTIIMSCLCLFMCYFGYTLNKDPMSIYNWSFSTKRLFKISIIFLIIGASFFFLILRLPQEITKFSLWTGRPVLYNFFASFLEYSLILACLLYLKRKSKASLIVVLFCLPYYFYKIFIGGRRGETVQFALIFLLSYWFIKRKALSRALFLIFILCFTLFSFSIGDYRSVMFYRVSSYAELKYINYIYNFIKIFEQGGIEMYNAVITIEASDIAKKFDFGTFHWNTFVFNFFPGQLLGYDVKSLFTIPYENPAYYLYGYIPPKGSTMTGLSDAFLSFWYFGCIKFFLISFILAKVYKSAIKGNLFAQYLYIFLIGGALHAITHHTQSFFSGLINFAICVLPFLHYAKKGRIIKCGMQ